jgi:hypothetical protein
MLMCQWAGGPSWTLRVGQPSGRRASRRVRVVTVPTVGPLRLFKGPAGPGPRPAGREATVTLAALLAGLQPGSRWTSGNPSERASRRVRVATVPRYRRASLRSTRKTRAWPPAREKHPARPGGPRPRLRASPPGPARLGCPGRGNGRGAESPAVAMPRPQAPLASPPGPP